MTTATKERKTAKRSAGTVIGRAELLEALGHIQPATTGARIRPILSNVLLHDGWITAMDDEIRIDCRIEWECDPLLLPYQRLAAILREVKDEEVELRPDGTSCLVKVKRGEWRLPVEKAEEFPLWDPSGLKPMPLIPADQFSRACHSVISAADGESGRYTLGGVLFEVSRDKGKCWLVATDGRRLSCAEMDLPMGRDVDDANPIVPRHAMSAIQKIADTYGKDGKPVDFEASENEIVASFERHRVSARLMQGQFPRWKDVFPSVRESVEHEIGHDVLASATRAAAIVTSEQSKGVLFTFSDGTLTLSAESTESGRSEVEVEVESYGSDGFVKLDPRFVKDVIAGLPTKNGEPTVSVSVGGPGDAVVFSYGQGGEYRSVVMPLAD